MIQINENKKAVIFKQENKKPKKQEIINAH